MTYEKIRNLCATAVMAALLCVLAPLSVPVGPIPITLATFCVYLAGALLGWKRAAAAVGLYLLLGCAGVPVFSGFTAGPQKLLGVTGGYLVGYLPCALMTGYGVQKFGDRPWMYPVSMVAGTIVLYVLGTAWFVALRTSTWAGALAACVLPFLPGDVAKIVAASAIGVALRGPILLKYQQS